MYVHVGFAERVLTLVARWAAMVTTLGADLDEPTGQYSATCPASAAEQASLRQVRSLRGLAR
jgi:hypothetical protein